MFKKRVLKKKESTVVIAIWINDCSIDNKNKQPRVNKEDFVKNIKEIVNKCRDDELITRVIFMSNINVNEEIINNADDCEFLFYNKDIKVYNNLLKDICIENNIEYIDKFWIMNNDDLEDWLHPNTKWHTKIFEKMKDYFNN